MNPRDALRQFGFSLLVAGVLCRPIPACGSGQALPSVSGNPTHGRDVLIEKGCLSCHASGHNGYPGTGARILRAGYAGTASVDPIPWKSAVVGTAADAACSSSV